MVKTGVDKVIDGCAIGATTSKCGAIGTDVWCTGTRHRRSRRRRAGFARAYGPVRGTRTSITAIGRFKFLIALIVTAHGFVLTGTATAIVVFAVAVITFFFFLYDIISTHGSDGFATPGIGIGCIGHCNS
jgi:hypothetical protein